MGKNDIFLNCHQVYTAPAGVRGESASIKNAQVSGSKSEGRVEREMDRQLGTSAVVMRLMLQSVVVTEGLSQRAKLLLVYWSVDA